MILAGDIGATNARLGVFEISNNHFRPVVVSKFRNRDYQSFGAILDEFLQNAQHFDSVCFGIAGPVIEGRVHLTNLNWIIDRRECQARFGTQNVWLLNDMEATGYGIGELQPKDLLILNQGTPDQSASAALIASGTGLGETALQKNGSGRVPLPAEAGHADFGANNELETELLLHLRKRFGHVSWDRVLSGPGLHLIYEFLRDSGRGDENPSIVESIRTADPGAVITAAGLNNECSLCVQALDVFVSIYGSEAGNMALRYLARAGVYLGGGIAPKIRAKLMDGTFMRAFVEKGRMKDMLKRVPVYVILNDQAALLGAAHYAAKKLS